MQNNTNMMGRLSADPTFKYLQNGNSVCNFRIAWEEHYKGEKKVYYYDCTAWNKLAENINKYCMKGSLVRVGGKLKTKEYENKQGIKVTNIYIECNEIDFLSSPKKIENKKDFTEEFNEAEKKFEISEEDIAF